MNRRHERRALVTSIMPKDKPHPLGGVVPAVLDPVLPAAVEGGADSDGLDFGKEVPGEISGVMEDSCDPFATPLE